MWAICSVCVHMFTTLYVQNSRVSLFFFGYPFAGLLNY